MNLITQSLHFFTILYQFLNSVKCEVKCGLTTKLQKIAKNSKNSKYSTKKYGSIFLCCIKHPSLSSWKEDIFVKTTQPTRKKIFDYKNSSFQDFHHILNSF